MNYLRENGFGRQAFGKSAEPVQAVSSVSGVSPRVVQQNGENYFNGAKVTLPAGAFVGLFPLQNLSRRLKCASMRLF